MSDFRGVEYPHRIDFTAEGLRRATEIPGILAFEIEGVASRQPLRHEPLLYRQHTAHPANRRLAPAPLPQGLRCRALG